MNLQYSILSLCDHYRVILTDMSLPLHLMTSSSTDLDQMVHPGLIYHVYFSDQAVEPLIKLPMAIPTTQPQELGCYTEGCRS